MSKKVRGYADDIVSYYRIYGGLLKEESRLVGYVDDVVAVDAGPTIEQTQSRLGILMPRVSRWMTAHDLNLKLEKNKVVILIKKKIRPCGPVRRVDNRLKTNAKVPSTDS